MDEQTPTAVQDNTAAAVSETTNVETTTTTETAETVETATETPPPPPGAPEAYTDFTLGEGVTILPEVMTKFSEYAKTQNMTQEVAQGTVDFYTKEIAPQIQAAQAKAWESQVTGWAKESETKYGKDGIEAANKALGRFSMPEFTKYLSESGLGNHPDMVGMFKKIGDSISESGFVSAQAKGDAKPIYSSMTGPEWDRKTRR